MSAPKMSKTAMGAAIAIAPIVGAAATKVFVDFQNKALVTTQYECRSPRVPRALDDFRIVQISDLHDATFGYQNDQLAQVVRAAEPDLIAITGDLIHKDTIDSAMAFVRHATSIAPVVFVTGNHEPSSPRYPELREQLLSAGVTVLEDGIATDSSLGIGSIGGHLTVIGLADQLFSPWMERSEPDKLVEAKLDALLPLAEDAEAAEGARRRPFRLLLAHRPELIGSYAREGVDLVLSGHAHGGQWRVPGVGGLYAPSQGLFPKYDAGSFQEGETTLVVSRGLGNSGFPLRLNNRPEVVVVTLRVQDADSAIRDRVRDLAAVLRDTEDAKETKTTKAGGRNGTRAKTPEAKGLARQVLKEATKEAAIKEAPKVMEQLFAAAAPLVVSAIIGSTFLGKYRKDV